MKLTLTNLVLAFSYALSSTAELDKSKLQNEKPSLRKQDVLVGERTANLNRQSTESVESPKTDTTNKNVPKDTKGDCADQTEIDKHETVKAKGDATENADDDMQYLSAAQVDNQKDQKSQKETTENNEHHEDLEDQQGDNNDHEDMEETYGQEEGEEEEGGDNEEDEATAAPLDKKNKRQVVLARGVGSLGDMMFQYATVSSIARSSKRRAIFSSEFTPLLTLFPKAPIVIIEDEEIVQLQPLTNITLPDTQISFDSVKQDIPDEGGVEIVGQTRSWKYFHVILNNLRNELSPAKFYIEAADDYLEEVMRRVLKTKLNDPNVENKNGEEESEQENQIYGDKGFLKFDKKKEKREESNKENKGKKKSEESVENSASKSDKDEPKSIIEQMKSPGDEITLVGIHVSAMFIDNDQEDDKEDKNKDNAKVMEEKKKQKEKAVLDYFHSAMDYYRDEHSISGDYVQFVVVCEHLRWCIDHLNGPSVHFAIGGSAELDMSILARCDHAILTPSSLSWWSSWQAGGQVVYPATLGEMNGLPIEDYVLPDWTEI